MATTGSEKIKSNTDDLSKNIQHMGNDVGRAVSEKVSSFTNVMRDNAGELLNKAGGLATDVATKAQEYGESAVDETSSFIRKYPSQSLLAGFGLGLLIGIGLARR